MNTDADRSLRLGRDLADALDRSDVVGRWMSYHLAELITRCEENPDDQELAETTRDVVLKLWEYKSGAPFQVQPFIALQPVLGAIARLDPDAGPWDFYRPFKHEVPSLDAHSTYPLLQTACDMDREIGRLIRVTVGIAAKQAISCEEPWVIEGMETAKTEEDQAVTALEELVRRLDLLGSGPDRLTLSTERNGTDGESSLASLVGPSGEEERPSKSVAAGDHASDAGETPNSSDPLSMALQGAIVRCRRLLDQLAELHNIAATDGENASNQPGAPQE